MGIPEDIQSFNDKIAGYFVKFEAAGAAFIAEVKKIGAIAEEDLPYVVEGFQVVGAIFAMIPGAGGVGAAMLTAATAVGQVDKAVKTIDGLIMDPASAVAIHGAEAVAKMPAATPDEKRKEAANRVVKEHNVPANTADALVAIAYAKTAKIEAAKPAV